MNRKSLGDKGEKLSVEFLKNKGYEILVTNYRTRYGGIDIIAKDRDVLVFAEVKTRTSRSYGTGLEAITPHKIDKIHQIAMDYIQKHYENEPACRFDAIEISGSEKLKILHVENAF